MRIATSMGLAILLAVLASPAIDTADAAHNTLTKQEIADGWILLYDGETLYGWAKHGGGKWKSEDGTLMAESGTDGWIGTRTEFSDFILKLQYRISGNGNSGIFFRMHPDAKDLGKDGYEMQIWDKDKDNPTGSLYNVATAEHPGGKLVTKVEEWQDVMISAEGRHIHVVLNGTQVIHVDDFKHHRGVIGLQYHYEGMKVEFRNIKLKPMNTKPIFNGKDLDGWKAIPERKSVFSVTPEGWLNIKNGNGDIQTVGEWGDFVLQLDIISNGKHLNSGVFFRGEAGEFWQGYESQIRNQWKGDDRTKPVDYGTGGIYNRQPARKVVSTDNEWFTKTLVATGNHIAVWINGYQVTDFTDKRKVGTNARESCKLGKGIISLQGHDPTTDLSFRNMKIASMRKRK